MRIGIDISSVTPGRTGIGVYTYELVRHLVRNPQYQFVLMFNSLRQPSPDFEEINRSNVEFRRYRLPGPAVLRSWQYFNLPDISFFTGKVDVFHSPATYVPPQRHGARVTTVHDIFFRNSLHATRALGGKYLAWICEHRLQTCHAVITPARAVAEEVEQTYLPGQKDKLYAVPSGVGERFLEPVPAGKLDEVRQRYELPDNFILHVGTLEPRKNLGVLVRAFARVREAMGAEAPKLVMVGDTGWGNEEFFETIRHLKLVGDVIVTGYAAHGDMAALYRLARCFVIPSHMEGFGLPLLEAMACETPVVCSSKVGALEIVPEASVAAFEAGDESALYQSLNQVLMDESSRAAMVALGRETAEHRTWADTAASILRVYEAAADRAASK